MSFGGRNPCDLEMDELPGQGQESPGCSLVTRNGGWCCRPCLQVIALCSLWFSQLVDGEAFPCAVPWPCPGVSGVPQHLTEGCLTVKDARARKEQPPPESPLLRHWHVLRSSKELGGQANSVWVWVLPLGLDLSWSGEGAFRAGSSLCLIVTSAMARLQGVSGTEGSPALLWQ